ncbi:MAG: threonine/serine exporter family protein [Ruminococcaceae bacterium]|nr:threonine/serine exporter family protein [Oscillospiraceae bacterium]
MEQNYINKHTLNIMLNFAEMMMASGAEVNRIEDSLTRIGLSCGAVKMDVYAIASNITITALDKDGISYTQTRRMTSVASTDFDMLDKLNSLSRDKCEGKITFEEFEEAVSTMPATVDSELKLYIGSMLAAGAFALFFGGSVWDAIASFFFGIPIYFMQSKFRSFCPNTIIFNLLTAFVVGICICIVAKIFNLNADKVIIGDIMLLIPGIAFTNSIRNLLVGDTNTGIMRLVETILWAAALALGFVLSIMLIGV